MKTYLVCGGRDFIDHIFVYKCLNKLHKKTPIGLIIHGAANGADNAGKMWAKDHNIPEKAYPADWDKNKKSAGYIRNKQMLAENKIDGVVAFPGGKGTDHMVKIAKEAGIVVWEPKPNYQGVDRRVVLC